MPFPGPEANRSGLVRNPKPLDMRVRPLNIRRLGTWKVNVLQLRRLYQRSILSGCPGWTPVTQLSGISRQEEPDTMVQVETSDLYWKPIRFVDVEAVLRSDICDP